MRSASLLNDSDFNPPINNCPTEVDDPVDIKPADWIDDPQMDMPGYTKPVDWVDEMLIEDPTASKPDDWLEDAPDLVPDSQQEAPDDWDVEEDGEWEAPLVRNPECLTNRCGKWTAPFISNPDYKGKWLPPRVDNPAFIGLWAPRQIPNPNFFVDDKPYAMAPIGGIGIELWTLQSGILFDNILLCSDPATAQALAVKTFLPRKKAESRDEPPLTYMQQMLLQRKQKQRKRDEL
uniref:Calnexin n=1 Tax=Haptolina brevifila TaxID=156173 RepID=A0A7S2N6G5_9EUKA